MTESVGTASICPWCSAEVPAGRAACPACGANLVETGESAVPGLTAIDAEAVLRNVRATVAPPRRNRILSLITGEIADEDLAPSGSPTALAPPPPEVRREMLRMEIAAELSNLNAEADAIAADEAVDGTRTDGTSPADGAEAGVDAPTAAAEAAAAEATAAEATAADPTAADPTAADPTAADPTDADSDPAR
ncbi:MAG TPA: hypothetical protein VFI28_05595 [Candidatus Limnocylindrales bacterium]|nr:hypothetical protein [Candidatus Limnocylindrales bacterium]